MSQQYNFLVEKPAEIDGFEAKSHQRIADSIFNTLSRNDIDVIGIEGELGSGKSTVIKLLEPKCQNKFEMIFFDVEKYQHGATKKALIETVFKTISADLDELSDAYKQVKIAKDTALGNRIKYDVTVDSRIDGWFFFFALSLIFAVTQSGNLIKGLAIFVEYLFSYVFSMKLKPEQFSIDFLAIFSGFILFIPCLIAWKSFKQRALFGKIPPSPGNLLKKGGTDTVNEFFDLNKEVGAFELQLALATFIEHIPDGRRYILIIDNLDRVTDDKLREVWSDIDVFSVIAHNKIKLLIPYSHRHVANSLCSSSNEGREFISKRLPVTFRVSPVISADWMGHFENMLSESVGEMSFQEKNSAGILISLLTDSEKRITPRYLKRLINAVVSIKLVGSPELNVLSAFFYQLTVADERYSLDDTLNIQLLDRIDEDVPEWRRLKRLVDARNFLLRTINIEQFSRDIVAIHYQADHDFAESELLTKPLRQAAVELNADPFITKQGIFGYERILRTLCDDLGWQNLVPLLASMIELSKSSPEVMKKKIDLWLELWVPIISMSAITTTEDLSLSIIKDMTLIVSSGHKFSLLIFEKEFEALDALSADFQKHEKYGYSELEKLHALSLLLTKKPNVINDTNIPLFKEYLWKNRESLEYWNIANTKLSRQKCFEILLSFSSNVPGDLANFLMSQYHLEGHSDGFRADWVKKTLPKNDFDVSELEGISSNELYTFCLSSDWVVSSNINIYKEHADKIGEDTRTVWDAQSIALVISLGTLNLIDNLSIKSEIDELFIKELAKAVVIHCSLAKIIKAAKDERTEKYASKVLRFLISNWQIYRLNVNDTAKEFDFICQSTNLEPVAVARWLDQWSHNVTIDSNLHVVLEQLSESFFRCVIDYKIRGFYKSFQQLLEGEYSNTEWWIRQLTSPQIWVRIFIQKLSLDKTNLDIGKPLRQAIEWIYSDDNSSLGEEIYDSDWILALLSVLRTQVRNSIMKHLAKVLNEYRTKSETQIAIFRVFGKHLKFRITSDSLTQEVVNTVFEHCPENIDDQDLQLSKWTNENIQHFVHLLITHEANEYKFPKITTNQTFKKARKKYEKG